MKVSERLYEDYLKKSRLNIYRQVLEYAKLHDYEMMGIIDYFHYKKEGSGTKKILINRHDIDTSPKVAREMFEIEKQIYGKQGSATYYFRWNTVDKGLIREIEEYGYETGYHYEEIADYEKEFKTKDLNIIKERLPIIQRNFASNLIKFREQTGSKSQSVASHGDFINVMYQYGNLFLLKDTQLRDELGIEVEAYDDIINADVDARFADQKLLDRFGTEVETAISSNLKTIMMLSHPRNWKVDLIENTKDNFRRAYQGIRYRL